MRATNPSSSFEITLQGRQLFFTCIGGALIALFVFLAGVRLGKQWTLSVSKPAVGELRGKHVDCTDWLQDQIRQKTASPITGP